MNLILPKRLLVTRRFKCTRCSFGFIKDTPSQVEKCPKCNNVVLERGVSEGNLNPYSKTKLRWYTDQSGKYHQDEISRRKIITTSEGKQVIVTDSHGRKIDTLYDVPTGKESGKSTNVRRE